MNPEDVVLAFLASRDGEAFWSFGPLADRTGLDRDMVRRACRSLAKRGLTEFRTGLWTEDGEPYGSGYGATPAGREAAMEARLSWDEETDTLLIAPTPEPAKPVV